MTERRPDPEALLARVKAEEARKRRGQLMLFFGAVAGVGKTYAMLEAAHALKADGVDVVVGYVEPHGRAETEALLEGLEQLPPRRVAYRGTTLAELDLDAALARRPTVVLVDELAHTNAPGSRHAKRWQDVFELLDAGITVYTTMNVQHVESLNDIVAKITGVVVRETVPDSVLERADAIELVDLPPDELLQRLAEGKVYVSRQAQDAVENFFRKGNLIALRELALRRTADQVDAEMKAYMREHAVRRTWPVSERILVCVSPSPLSAELVRAGRRLAARIGAEWIVAYVETPKAARLPQEARDRVVQTLRLAEQLGAETVTLSGTTMSEEILAYARARNVSKIVIGKPGRSLWRRIVLGSIVDALVRGSGEIDIYVVSGDRHAEPIRTPRIRPRPVAWSEYALSLATVAACTGLAWLMFDHVGLSNLIMVYLLGVVLVATRAGRAPTAVASVLSVALFDFYFVPPYLTFAVADTEHFITFAVMLVVALVISGLTLRSRAEAERARQRERRIATLYAMSRGLTTTRDVDAIVDTALRHIGEAFPGQLAALLPGADGRVAPRRTYPPDVAMDDSERAVAHWVYEHRQLAGLGTATLPGARALYVPLVGSEGAVGVLGVTPADGRPLESPEQLHQLETFANQMALAIERAHASDKARRAAVRAEAERLRNSLLSSVSHDLRTPLASITGAASSLLESGTALDDATRAELLSSIRQEAERLDRLVDNLLEMTRLEAGGVTIRRESQPIEGVLGVALKRLDARLTDREVHIDLPRDLPRVPIDAMLIEQVLVNLIENAATYTPAGSAIDVSASAVDGAVRVAVADRGPGLLPGEETRVFDKFYRSPHAKGRGIGLGLAISRAIVEAHGGRIGVDPRPGGGAVFHFTLPVGDVPLAPVSADG